MPSSCSLPIYSSLCSVLFFCRCYSIPTKKKGEIRCNCFWGYFVKLGGNLKRNKGAQHWAAIWKLPLRDDCWYNDNSPPYLDTERHCTVEYCLCVISLSLYCANKKKNNKPWRPPHLLLSVLYNQDNFLLTPRVLCCCFLFSLCLFITTKHRTAFNFSFIISSGVEKEEG